MTSPHDPAATEHDAEIESIVDEFQKHANECTWRDPNDDTVALFPIDNVKDWLRTRLTTLLDEIQEAVEGKRELHRHNSIPSFTADLDEGCIVCVRNDGIEAALLEIKKRMV